MHTGFTRKRVLGIVCFVLLFALLFAVLDHALRCEGEYSGAWTRIRNTGSVPEAIILGNSHAFCSFVPELLNETLGLDSAVLASSGLNSIGTTETLQAVLSVGNPKYVIVEANAYLFLYDDTALYHKDTTLSHINGMPRLKDRIRCTYRMLGFENIPQGAFQLLRADLMWKRWQKDEPLFAADGTSLLQFHASGSVDVQGLQTEARTFASSAVATNDMDPRNEAQLRRLMELARENGTAVFLVKTPTAGVSRERSNQLKRMEQIAGEYGDTFLGLWDANTQIADMGLTLTDFYDSGHLNRSGAAKFTLRFAKHMGERFGKETCLDDSFAYAGECIETLENGDFRYTAYALGNHVRYGFFLDGEPLAEESEQNSMVLSLDPNEAGRLSVRMSCNGEEISFRFMQPNTCILH